MTNTHSPIVNNNKHYLVIDGRLTQKGIKFLKLMNVYNKSNRNIK
jgi:hypothetical protein